jgi:hypothetical protein
LDEDFSLRFRAIATLIADLLPSVTVTPGIPLSNYLARFSAQR